MQIELGIYLRVRKPLVVQLHARDANEEAFTFLQGQLCNNDQEWRSYKSEQFEYSDNDMSREEHEHFG